MKQTSAEITKMQRNMPTNNHDCVRTERLRERTKQQQTNKCENKQKTLKQACKRSTEAKHQSADNLCLQQTEQVRNNKHKNETSL